ncbi:MAG TPA: DUF2786 domain-containing protein, partial [Acidimicrobiales bacterium]
AHAELVRVAIVHHATRWPDDQLHPEWRSQLQGLRRRGAAPSLDQWLARHDDGHAAIRRAIEVVALMQSLGPVAELVPPPCRRTTRATPRREPPPGLDPKVLARVRALLAKAESTQFPGEAEALTTKAAELMARHAIDRAMLEAAGSMGGDGTTPVGRRIAIDDPYAFAKALLLHVVADASRGKSVWNDALGAATVVAYPVDLAVIELLYTSLLVQASHALSVLGAAPAGARTRSRRYRQSFLVAFADRIGQRLEQARQATLGDATRTHGAALVPVLAGRRERVEHTVDELFPTKTSRAASVRDREGYIAGRAAADQASLDAAKGSVPPASAKGGAGAFDAGYVHDGRPGGGVRA